MIFEGRKGKILCRNEREREKEKSFARPERIINLWIKKKKCLWLRKKMNI